MSWNYRLVHRFDYALQESVYAIHEAFYDEDKDEPHSISENPSYPQGTTWEEFLADFSRYQASSLYPRKRILEYSDFDKKDNGENSHFAPFVTGEGSEYFDEEHLKRVREAREEREIEEAKQTVRPIENGAT